MARRHYRRHRRLGGRLSLKSVRSQDLALGGVIGLLGSAAAVGASDLAVSRGAALPSVLTSQFAPGVIGGVLAAVGTYVVSGKNRNRLGRTIGALIGGIGGGFASGIGYTPAVATAGWGFSPRTLPSGMGAPLFNNPRMAGPIFNNPNSNLARLGSVQGFGDENEDGNFPAP